MPNHAAVLDSSASPEAIFAVLSDLDRLPEWLSLVTSASVDGPLREGAPIECVVDLGGQGVKVAGTVSRLEADHRVTLSLAGPGVQATVDCAVEAATGGSRVKYGADLQLSGLAKLASGTISRKLPGEMDAAARRLVDLAAK